MTDTSSVGLAASFLAGAVSFVSPCVLPLVPGYISYIAGQASGGPVVQTDRRRRAIAVLLSAFFVAGFGAVFVALGASASALGQFFLRYRYEANIVAGVMVMLFGLVMVGALGRVTWFQRDFRLHPRLAGGHPVTAFALGVAFGFGWTPCIGPVLGAILTVSAVQSSFRASIGLLIAYALGLGLPFVLSAIFLRELLGRLKFLRGTGRALQIATGVVLIGFGAAMATGRLSAFAIWLLETFPALGRIG